MEEQSYNSFSKSSEEMLLQCVVILISLFLQFFTKSQLIDTHIHVVDVYKIALNSYSYSISNRQNL